MAYLIFRYNNMPLTGTRDHDTLLDRIPQCILQAMKHVVVMMFCLRSINTSGYSWPDGCSSLSSSVFGSFLLCGSLESIILCSSLQSYEAISSHPLAFSYFTTVNNIRSSTAAFIYHYQVYSYPLSGYLSILQANQPQWTTPKNPTSPKEHLPSGAC